MSKLFSPLSLRGLTFKNRIFVSPMCQYSAEDGIPNLWHMVHLGSRAVGGAALVMAEATAVSPEGRISPADLGIWSEVHVNAFSPIVEFLKEEGAVPAIQIAHAGRKASTDVPWHGGQPLGPAAGGWETVAPSALPFAPGWPAPRALAREELDGIVTQFAEAATRSLEAGFEVVEIHMAHGYLLHEFLSPIANQRGDEYGGSLENRVRLPLQVAEAVRAVWPDDKPVFVRISATDWVDGGWELAQSIQLAQWLKLRSIDMIDCSSGGMVMNAQIPAAPGFQVPFAEAIRRETGVATGAVGLITEPAQAEQIVATDRADAIFMAREFLRDPYWPLHAARALGVDLPWPVQYARAKPH